jgi:hypothetical protein
MSNPYQSPQFASQPTVPFAPPGSDREKLRRVAKFQQWVIYALLAMIVLYIAFGAARQGPILIRGPIALAYLATWVFSMVAIFLLAKELHHVGLAVLCAVLMIVPCISLLALLMINGKATGYLQQHGIKVGFMGVNPNTI